MAIPNNIAGSTSAINDALSRRGLGMGTPTLDQMTGGSPMAQKLPPVPTPPTGGMAPSSPATPKTPSPAVGKTEAEIIIKALSDRLNKLAPTGLTPTPTGVPPVPTM